MPQSSVDASPPAAASSLVGQVISARYRVTELIATGGMSAVYLGQHVHMLKRVAIKVLDPKAEKLPELVARFQREAIAGAHVQHPNIVSATDFGQLNDGSYFLVLEYVAGATLNHVIAKGALAVPRAVSIARQLALGLAAAHDVGIVHRDVKPANVIVVQGSNDEVKLIDFGFAQVRLSKVPTIAPPPDEPSAPEKFLTQAGVVLGTVAYMSPEAALGMAAVDQRSDLYALGLILYELLSGKHPFDETEPVRLFLQHRTTPPPPLAVRAPDGNVPPALEAVVMKLLEKDPKERYASAREVVSALDAAMMSAAFEMVPDIAAISGGPGLFDDAVGDVLPAPPPPALPPNTERAASEPPLALGTSQGGKARFSWMPPWLERAWNALPSDGKFPRWAYAGLPALSVFIVVVIGVLFSRKPSDRGAVVESAAPAPASSTAEPPLPPTREPIPASALDGDGWRITLRNAVREKDWPKGTGAVIALLGLDPAALREHDTQVAARAVAVAVDQAGGDASEQFFAMLTSETGTAGLDLLYDVARHRPGTKAAKRATEVLRRPETMARASAELKVLVDFREASCLARRDLFPRMADQGDERALFELVVLREAECSRRRDPCCFKESRALGEAVRTLRTKLAPAPSPPHPPL